MLKQWKIFRMLTAIIALVLLIGVMPGKLGGTKSEGTVEGILDGEPCAPPCGQASHPGMIANLVTKLTTTTAAGITWVLKNLALGRIGPFVVDFGLPGKPGLGNRGINFPILAPGFHTHQPLIKGIGSLLA